MAKTYKRGDRVLIVAGKYKEHGEGEFLNWSGAWSASVNVKGDTRSKRTLRLSSLRPWPITPGRESTNTANDKSNHAQKEEILSEIAVLVQRLKALELKVKEL